VTLLIFLAILVAAPLLIWTVGYVVSGPEAPFWERILFGFVWIFFVGAVGYFLVGALAVLWRFAEYLAGGV